MDENKPLLNAELAAAHAGVTSFHVTGDASGVCEGDRKGFVITESNCRSMPDEGEVIPQFNPSTYNDFDLCYVIPKEVKKGDKMMSVDDVREMAMSICRARFGGDFSRYNDVSSLHPVYRLDNCLDREMTKRDFHKLMMTTFFNVLNHIHTVYVVDEGHDKAVDTYIRVRLLEEASMSVAEFKEYPLRMDRECTKYPDFREDAEYCPPYMSFERDVEMKAGGLGGAVTLNGGKLWTRFDRLGYPVHNSAELPAQHPELSLFRDVDRIRLLNMAVTEFLNLEVLESKKWFKTHYALKQQAKEEVLKATWANFKYLWTPSQPLDSLRDYFGEEVAFYFAWMGFYTQQLMYPAAVGILVTALVLIFDPASEYMSPWLNYTRLFYCIFLGSWCAWYYQGWQRKERILSLKWGDEAAKMSRALNEENPRFKPDGYIVDPVQPDRYLKYGDPTKRRLIEAATATILVVSTFLCAVAVNEDFSRGLAAMLGYPMSSTFGEAILRRTHGDAYVDHSLFLVTITTITIKLLDKMWSKKIAGFLTDLENHQYMSAYQNSLNFKLFFFKLVDYFAMLCYLAFFKEYIEPCDDTPDGRCIKSLRRQLIALVIVEASGTIKEIAMPVGTFFAKKFLAKAAEDMPPHQMQGLMNVYDSGRKGVTGDYLDQMINFGITSMFSLIMPVLPLVTACINLLEIRTDAFKLLNTVRRPFPKQVADQGIWDDIQRLVCLFTVVVNVALCAFCTIGYYHGLAFRLFWSLVLIIIGVSIQQVIAYKMPPESSNYKIMKARNHVVYSDAIWGDRDVAKLAQAFGAPSRL